MDRHPTRLDLLAAECRLLASRREVHARMGQVRSSVTASLAKPSTLLGIAGLGLLAGILMQRTGRRRRTDAGGSAGAAAAPAAGGIIGALIARYGWPQLSRWAMTLWSSRDLWMPARNSMPAAGAQDAAAQTESRPPF